MISTFLLGLRIGFRMVVQENAVERVLQCSKCLLPEFRFQLAFPNSDAVPAKLSQQFLVSQVTLFVSCDFCRPEVSVGLWHLKRLATIVTMPEAAIDKDAGAVFPHHEVGMPWQSFVKQAVSKSP